MVTILIVDRSSEEQERDIVPARCGVYGPDHLGERNYTGVTPHANDYQSSPRWEVRSDVDMSSGGDADFCLEEEENTLTLPGEPPRDLDTQTGGEEDIQQEEEENMRTPRREIPSYMDIQSSGEEDIL